MKGSIKAQTALRQLKRAGRFLKQEYLLLCRKEKLSATECRFTALYPEINKNIAELTPPKLSLSANFDLAKEIILQSGKKLLNTERIIMLISGVRVQRKITSAEIETLKQALMFEIITSLARAVEADDKVLLLNMFKNVAKIDFNAITKACDPLHAYLFECDETYRESDETTQAQYRHRVCELAKGDEIEAAAELIEYAKKHALDLSEVLCPTYHRPTGRAVILIVCYLCVAASISIGASLLALEWWVAVMLILPSLYAARVIVNSVALFGQKPHRLWRLSETSPLVKNEKLVAVLYTVLSESADLNRIAEALKKLSSTISGNAKIVWLADLSSEQAPVIPDDSITHNAVNEVITRLNECEHGRYAAVIRKRAYSKSQEEYIGSGGKRGALLELAEYMQHGNHDFAALFGEGESLIGTRFFAVVDEDSVPKLNAVNTLLQIALHPCNLPKVKNSMVTKGYGIVAPGSHPKLESTLTSGFARFFAPKNRKADVFFALFGEGTFKGQGIINTEIYLQTNGVISAEKTSCPEILEGEWLKCALADDVSFYYDFPDIPQRFYRRLMLKVRGCVYNLPYAFKKQTALTSRIKLIGRFIGSIAPVGVMANMFAAFWLYPPAAEFAALLGLALWLLPSLTVGFGRTAYSIVMLPTLAQKTLSSLISAVVRGLTGKRIFTHNLSPADPLSFYLLPMLLSLALFRSPAYAIRLVALFFALMPAVLALSEHETYKREQRLTFKETKDLTQYITDSWRFFSEYVTEADNDLPPKSVQFSPVYRIIHQTGPKEIGLYLTSCMGAYDLKLLTAQGLVTRVERCLDSVEKLAKFKGCLFESYNTHNLSAESNLILSEDMGVYICSLANLSEGLKELGKVYDKADILAERVERMIDLTDLGIFYDDVSGLMCKSFNTATQAQSDEHHQHLMSVSRLCSFYAIARSNVPQSHWQNLKREAMRNGFSSGLASLTGGMEEFFLPEIFLKSPQGSTLHESLKYALFVHKKLGLAKGLPFGLSESGVHLFDSALGYRTQKLGAPKAAAKPASSQSYAVSPHSSMLALGFGAHACTENLLKLKKAGAYGNFGFFEAVDYTLGSGEAVVKCLNSYHVGQIIAGGVNALSKGLIQKRMAKNRYILGALELLEERTLPTRRVLRKPKALLFDDCESEIYSDISPQVPRVKLLNNGEYSLILTDSGTSIALKNGLSVYETTHDPWFKKRGIFAAVKTEASVIMLDSPDELVCKFSDSGVSYEKSDGKVFASESVCLHPFFPCEVRRFSIKNLTDKNTDVTLLVYIEPTLLKPYEKNTERKRLSLRLERDDRQKIITVSRADADCSQCFAIGFCEDISAQSSFDKESVFSGCDSVADVFENAELIAPSLVCEPEPCVFIKAKIHLKADSSFDTSMFVLGANSHDELSAGVSALRGHGWLPFKQQSTKALVLSQLMLPHILFGKRADESESAFNSGLLPCVPLIILRLNDKNDDEKLRSYLEAYKVIRSSGIATQMAVVFNDRDDPERRHYAKLLEVSKRCDVLEYIYLQGGIIPIDEHTLESGASDNLCRLASFTIPDEIIPKSPEHKRYREIVINKVSPESQEVSDKTLCGGFNGVEYIITERPQVKWRHVLSNPVFGAVVENASLGKTSFGDFNERLLLEFDGRYYDILNGATACFAPNSAVYKAVGEGFKSEVKISVSAAGMCKKCKVKITSSQKCKIAYVLDISGEVKACQGSVVLKLKDNFCGISASKCTKPLFDKEAFFFGDWEEKDSPQCTDFCAVTAPLSGAEEVSFYLSFGASEKAVTKMPACFKPPPAEKASSNRERQLSWARYQLINGRIYLGDGLGNFDFAGLLQDACAIADTSPERCKAEILRCAYHQFSDGDACARFLKPGAAKENKRTTSSLAHLWLPLAVSEYIKKTDDFRFLDIGVRYFDSSSQKESVYEHCRRAIDLSFERKGTHGLMLNECEREAVWLSEFFVIVLDSFCEVSRRKGDNLYTAQLMSNAKTLREAINMYCKDSDRYIGGYLPLGKTWGSAKNDACKISLLPQVLAQFARLDEHFDRYALLTAYDNLCDSKRGITKLFAPPFDPDSELTPIESRYLPHGIKENGGQITAAAILMAAALKRAGLTQEANSIFKTLPPEERAKMPGYKQEPYYICGEVYSNKNCYGKGAEPIFNSAAAWYYRLLTSDNNNKDPQA